MNFAVVVFAACICLTQAGPLKKKFFPGDGDGPMKQFEDMKNTICGMASHSAWSAADCLDYWGTLDRLHTVELNQHEMQYILYEVYMKLHALIYVLMTYEDDQGLEQEVDEEAEQELQEVEDTTNMKELETKIGMDTEEGGEQGGEQGGEEGGEGGEEMGGEGGDEMGGEQGGEQGGEGGEEMGGEQGDATGGEGGEEMGGEQGGEQGGEGGEEMGGEQGGATGGEGGGEMGGEQGGEAVPALEKKIYEKEVQLAKKLKARELLSNLMDMLKERNTKESG